jgi:hypothetical protein
MHSVENKGALAQQGALQGGFRLFQLELCRDMGICGR